VGHTASPVRTARIVKYNTGTVGHTASPVRTARIVKYNTGTVGHTASPVRTARIVKYNTGTVGHTASPVRTARIVKYNIGTVGHTVSSIPFPLDTQTSDMRVTMVPFIGPPHTAFICNLTRDFSNVTVCISNMASYAL
jgi:hypothetical protein